MLVISSLQRVPGLVASEGVGRVLSLLGPAMEPPKLPLAPGQHLKLTFHDVASEQPGYISPNAGHVEAMIAFAQAWDQRSPFLIHCFAGISRSTAAAFIILCALKPKEKEIDFALTLRSHSPHAFPNRRLIDLADDLLQREGRMRAAVEAMGPHEEAFEGNVVRWPFATR